MSHAIHNISRILVLAKQYFMGWYDEEVGAMFHGTKNDADSLWEFQIFFGKICRKPGCYLRSVIELDDGKNYRKARSI